MPGSLEQNMWQKYIEKNGDVMAQHIQSSGGIGIHGWARLLLVAFAFFANPVSADLDISAPSDRGAYTLSWSAPAKGYSTLKQLVSPGHYQVIKTGTETSISFEKAPGVYHYRLDEYGCFSNCSVVKISYEKVLVPPRIPDNLRIREADVADNYILRWNASPGANLYVLQERRNNGPWANVHTSSNDKILLPVKGSGNISYRVRACGPFIGCSGYSSVASIGVGNPADAEAPLEIASK